jgi:hypothetical protein
MNFSRSTYEPAVKLPNSGVGKQPAKTAALQRLVTQNPGERRHIDRSLTQRLLARDRRDRNQRDLLRLPGREAIARQIFAQYEFQVRAEGVYGDLPADQVARGFDRAVVFDKIAVIVLSSEP